MKLLHQAENLLLSVLWPFLPLASIAYSAAIAGTWLNGRVVTHYAHLDGLGYFGAGLAGAVMFGGVALLVRGSLLGIPAAAFPGLALAIMDGMFFASDGFFVAVPLALFGVGSAITAGVVNTANVKAHEQAERDAAKAQADAAAKQAQAERDAAAAEQARKDAERRAEHEHARELERLRLEGELDVERIRARADARAVSRSIPSHMEQNETRPPILFHSVPHGTERNGTGGRDGMERARALVAYVEQNTSATFDEIEKRLDIPRSTASRLLKSEGWRKPGKTWERVA